MYLLYAKLVNIRKKPLIIIKPHIYVGYTGYLIYTIVCFYREYGIYTEVILNLKKTNDKNQWQFY